MKCLDFTCGLVETCPKCWSASFVADVARSLGRPLAEGTPPPRPRSKPKRTFAEQARIRERCQEFTRSGKPCPDAVAAGCCAGLRWISSADLVAAAVKLGGMIPPDARGVVGLPRSGMAPAAIVATQHHLPLYQLDTAGKVASRRTGARGLQRLGNGSRGRSWRFAEGDGPFVVIDDTVYGGGAMRRARAAMGSLPAVYGACFVRPEARGAVDLAAELLPSPHLLEWNLMNQGIFVGRSHNPIFGAGVACDFDGILCHDAESAEKGGVLGAPYLVPRAVPVRLIVTGRHERHRAVTERWLERWGVHCERLEMWTGPHDWERIAEFKATHFRGCRCGFFLESCPKQAERIYTLASKPVICPIVGRVFQ